jgi:hypothetical protein
VSDPFAPTDPVQRAIAARNMPQWFVQLMHDGEALLSTADVAAELGIKTSRVRQLAREHRLGYATAGGRIFSSADVAALRQRETRRGRKRANEVAPASKTGAENT